MSLCCVLFDCRSLLVMQGKSADRVRRAISSTMKPRTILVFGKSQQKKHLPLDGMRLTSPITPHASPWGPPSNRPPNHARHPSAPKHYGSIPTSGVLQAPSARPQHTPTLNGIQPLFVAPAPVATAPVPYPAPVSLPPTSSGWTLAVPSRHTAPRLPVPGTGVFLPPPGSGSGHPSQQPPGNTMSDDSCCPAEMPAPLENDNGTDKFTSNSNYSPKFKADAVGQRHECNGNLNGGPGGSRVVCKEDQQTASARKKVASKPMNGSKQG
uniref:Uncharacterized protein n=1 Tax=Anthurium amnicola TaxID=1678845 RepID=A0A1D1XUV2_9ARAE